MKQPLFILVALLTSPALTFATAAVCEKILQPAEGGLQYSSHFKPDVVRELPPAEIQLEGQRLQNFANLSLMKQVHLYHRMAFLNWLAAINKANADMLTAMRAQNLLNARVLESSMVTLLKRDSRRLADFYQELAAIAGELVGAGHLTAASPLLENLAFAIPSSDAALLTDVMRQGLAVETVLLAQDNSDRRQRLLARYQTQLQDAKDKKHQHPEPTPTPSPSASLISSAQPTPSPVDEPAAHATRAIATLLTSSHDVDIAALRLHLANIPSEIDFETFDEAAPVFRAQDAALEANFNTAPDLSKFEIIGVVLQKLKSHADQHPDDFSPEELEKIETWALMGPEL